MTLIGSLIGAKDVELVVEAGILDLTCLLNKFNHQR
jgi:hypothetical protein